MPTNNLSVTVDIMNLDTVRQEFDKLLDIVRQVDDVLTTNWVSVKNNDYCTALNELIEFNIQVAAGPAVNGGSILLTLDDRIILNRLLSDYHVGPAAKVVLDKLKAGL
jgi:hypothetical protein